MSKVIEIDRQPIELYKILKFESLVASGGEAKMVINSGLVKVNEAVETQKRKKIVNGNTIEFSGQKFLVRFKTD
jgi:ribosome-associated protein